ncbi:hypothetical protein BRD13_05205 [Halobacteriales archaeon SW_5_70_135]|nr:MAG: hypothetical protein BRD13_05205 [Halobacteriales archaeon SW_5_70_135]
MVTASAPGKVYLFGEHAVVYGESVSSRSWPSPPSVRAWKYRSALKSSGDPSSSSARRARIASRWSAIHSRSARRSSSVTGSLSESRAIARTS